MTTKKNRGDARRQRIAEAVVDCLAQHGLQHTTFEAIGKRVRMERSHLVYYYPNHDELISGAVRWVSETAQEITARRVKGAKSPKDRVRAIIAAAFEHLRAYPKHAAVLTLAVHLCTHDRNYRFLFTRIRETGVERLADVLDAYLKGRGGSPERLREHAKAVQSIITGYAVEWMSTDYFSSLAQAKAQCERAVFAVLSGGSARRE